MSELSSLRSRERQPHSLVQSEGQADCTCPTRPISEARRAPAFVRDLDVPCPPVKLTVSSGNFNRNRLGSQLITIESSYDARVPGPSKTDPRCYSRVKRHSHPG